MRHQESVVPDREENPLLWRMEGIDVKAGLEYAGQDAELYREILSEYADCIETQAQAIERAVKERNIETYTIEVHSLKSTSRTVGALDLSNMAKEMEWHGKNREWEAILEGTAGLLALYRGMYGVIMPYHVNDGQGTEKKSAENGVVQGLLSELLACLEEYDAARAEEILKELSVYDFAGEDAVYMERLTAALGRFDYEACLTLGSRWRSELLQTDNGLV